MGYRFNTIGVSDGISMGTGEGLAWGLWSGSSSAFLIATTQAPLCPSKPSILAPSYWPLPRRHVVQQSPKTPSTPSPPPAPPPDGMSYSRQSRDLIADSIETVMSAQAR